MDRLILVEVDDLLLATFYLSYAIGTSNMIWLKYMPYEFPFTHRDDETGGIYSIQCISLWIREQISLNRFNVWSNGSS